MFQGIPESCTLYWSRNQTSAVVERTRKVSGAIKISLQVKQINFADLRLNLVVKQTLNSYNCTVSCVFFPQIL